MVNGTNATNASEQPAAAWTVLDTCFGHGARFLQTWLNWRAQPLRPVMLHYVGLLNVQQAAALATHLQDVIAQAGQAEAALAGEFFQSCYGLEAGFHRLLLNQGQVSLTLCVGEPLAQLAELQMQAQHIWAIDSNWSWDKWRLKAIARLCAVGARVSLPSALPLQSLDLTAAGFSVIHSAHDEGGLEVCFAPGWHLRDRRYAVRSEHAARPRCAVIGAGLAGASVAHALALRGWPVDVYDQAGHCAAGASGLPAGVLVAHYSQDDSPRSRMSRNGARLMLDHAKRLLEAGLDWDACGVMEFQHDEVQPSLPQHDTPWTSDGASHLTRQYWERDLPKPQGCLWHALGGWLKPAQMVAAWLSHPGIVFHRLSPVHALEQDRLHNGGRWGLLDIEGTSLGRADVVVFANARGCIDLINRLARDHADQLQLVPDLLAKLGQMQILHGSLSHGTHVPVPNNNPFPPFAVNGNGSFLSNIPDGDSRNWYTGSTFEKDVLRAVDNTHTHASNQTRLRTLLPQAAHALESQFASDAAQCWTASRCVSHDRLPLVGPVEAGDAPSLWMSAAMGARGLSFSALCAELLMAQMAHEPLPVEASLAKGLYSMRVRRRKLSETTA